MIKLSHFTKKYGPVCAVTDLTLEVQKGEIFGFIGRNGAGKTTTIRFLATLIRASAGDAQVAGFSVTTQPLEARRHLGYMPDSFADFPGFRVKTFLDFFAQAYGFSGRTRANRVDQLLTRFGLSSYASRDVRKLSRGLKQRLYLARALIHDPPVLILDEPTAGLDPYGRIEFKQLLKELARQGKTVFLSSHVLGELADIATRVGIIEQGKLALVGPIREVVLRHHRARRIEVRYLGDQSRLKDLLPALAPQVRCLEILDGRAILETDAAENQLAEVLRALVMGGISVTEFRPVEPTLEELFIQSAGLREDTGKR